MLTAMRVGNFKALAESQLIPIRPLTLIYGANSSGKSSILHSLILARHAQETGELDVHRTNVGGDAVDLGGFRQFIHQRDVNRRMEWSAELDTVSFKGRLGELLAPVKCVTVTLEIGLAQLEEMKEQDGVDARTGEKVRIKIPTGNLVPAGDPEVTSYSVAGDGKPFIQMSKRRDGKLKLDRLDHEHPVFREVLKAIVESSTTTENILPSDYEGLVDAITLLVPEVLASAGKLLPEGLAKSESFKPGSREYLFPVSRSRRSEDLAAAVRFFIPRTLDELIRGIGEAVHRELTAFQYLGPLRSYPPRHLAFSQHHDPNWYAGGDYAWDILRHDAEVREKVNKWLGSKERLQTPYGLSLKDFIEERGFDNEIYEGIEKILDQIRQDDITDEFEETGNKWYESKIDRFADVMGNAIWKSQADRLQELVLYDRRTHTVVSHRDVGIGISQVLPVLVGAYASRKQIIAIEQPEIHLHPALQADLGDVFIQSALGGAKNRFLIETHSEHLLLRIMRRMRETSNGDIIEGMPQVTPKDVCVLFVQPKGTSAAVRHLELDKDGQLLDAWPGGFFEEGYRERFS